MENEFDNYDEADYLYPDFDADWRQEEHDADYIPPEHDDMYDLESGLGSCGWGTDEYYSW